MKFLIMQFSPTSCHFISLLSKYSHIKATARLKHIHNATTNLKDRNILCKFAMSHSSLLSLMKKIHNYVFKQQFILVL
jgi:hypothetical protein